MLGRLNITSRGYRFLCQCELCSLQGEQLDRDEESRRINIRRIAEINCLADNIPLELGESQQKTKYKYCCLNLLHTMEQMNMPVPSLFLVKSCIFSIYILLEESETALIWARDLCQMSSLLTGREWNIPVKGIQARHLSGHNNTLKDIKRCLAGAFFGLVVCCYSIDLVASIVRFNQ